MNRKLNHVGLVIVTERCSNISGLSLVDLVDQSLIFWLSLF